MQLTVKMCTIWVPWRFIQSQIFVQGKETIKQQEYDKQVYEHKINWTDISKVPTTLEKKQVYKLMFSLKKKIATFSCIIREIPFH